MAKPFRATRNGACSTGLLKGYGPVRAQAIALEWSMLNGATCRGCARGQRFLQDAVTLGAFEMSKWVRSGSAMSPTAPAEAHEPAPAVGSGAR